MKPRCVLIAVLTVTAATSAGAQLSSDIPGVPRALISMRGGRQNRTEWDLIGYKIPGAAGSAGGMTGGGVRLAFGTSYRIHTQFELGYDFTFVEATGVFPAKALNQDNYMRALAGYGLRLGLKYRPISSVDIDGYGYQVAIGGAWEPALKPAFGYDKLGDSSRTGGQFSGGDRDTATFYPTNPFAKHSSSTTLGVMGSYRTRRITADAALMSESVSQRTAADGVSPVDDFHGVSLNLGATFKLTPSFGVGGSFWGTGSPPWRDETVIGNPGTRVGQQFAFLLQFGSSPEAGVDLMLTSPTGNLSQSARLYIRIRSTQ